MKKISIVTNRIKDPAMKLAKKIAGMVSEISKDCKTLVLDLDDMDLKAVEGSDCVLVLGGDGTLLTVAKKTLSSKIPLIGVNLGTIGFLAEIEKKNIKPALEKLLKDDYVIEDRMMLTGEVIKTGKSVTKSSALNDVVLSRMGEQQLIGYRVYVNGLYLNDFYADGIILSTPTGSTAYNMSAGGSIVEPRAKLIMLTPVCPHTLSTRSIVLSATDKVTVEILESKGEKEVEVGVNLDGANAGILTTGDKVVISKAKNVTRLCRLSDMSFLEILQKKMNS